MKKFLFILLLTVLMVLPAFASGTKDAAGSTAGSGSVKAVDYNETATLNLDWMGNTESMVDNPWVSDQCMCMDMLFNTLIQNNGDKTKMLPELATSWKIAPDGLKYTFTITDKAVWHDGVPLTVDDILWSYNTILKIPKSSKKKLFKQIVGAQDVIDGKAQTVSGITVKGNTISFKLIKPDNTLIGDFFGRIQILPKHLLGEVDPSLLSQYEPYWSKPVGSGQYKIAEVSYPNYLKLVRNDAYFGPKVKIKNVLFISHKVGGADSIVSDLIAGNLDYAYGNAINDINAAKNIIANNPNIKMETFAGGYLRRLMFNLGTSKDGKHNDDVDKKEVRQAFNLLLDKKAMASLYPGQGVVMTTMVNPSLPKYNKDIPLFKRDVEKAKEMLKEANFDFSRPVRILYYYGDQTTADLMAIMTQNFADAGVIAKPFLATGDLASIIYKMKNYDIIYLGGGSSKPIQLYNEQRPGGNKIIGDVPGRKIFEDLLSEYLVVNDPVKIKELGDKIQAAGYDLDYVIPIYGLNEIILYNYKKLKVDPHLFDAIPRNNYRFENWELISK